MRLAIAALLVGLTLPASGTIGHGAHPALPPHLARSVTHSFTVGQLPAVANLRSTIVGTTVQFDWDPPPEPIVSYLLEAGSASGLTNIIVLDTKSISTTLTVSDVPAGVYFVRVRAVGTDGMPGPVSNEVVVRVGVPCGAAPDAPLQLLQEVQGSHVTLTWLQPPAGDAPTSYAVEAGSASGLTDLAALDTGSAMPGYGATAPSGVYFVRVRGRNACGLGPPSNEVIVAITGCTPASAPVSLASQVTGSQLTLTWSPPPSGGPVISYVFDAGSAPGLSNIASFDTQSSMTTLTRQNVPPGTYWVRARARTACGLGAVSDEISFVIEGGPGSIDCVEGPWSEWRGTSEWSACTNGQRSRSEVRTRGIITLPQNGGRACGPLEESRVHNETCGGPPVDCVVSEWSAWQPISEWSACSNFQRSRRERRMRSIVQQPANGGQACPTNLTEERVWTEPCTMAPVADIKLYQSEPGRLAGFVKQCTMVGINNNVVPPEGGNAVCELRGDGSTPSSGLAYQWDVKNPSSLCRYDESDRSRANLPIRCTCTVASKPPPAFRIEATLTIKNSAGQAAATLGFDVLPAT